MIARRLVVLCVALAASAWSAAEQRSFQATVTRVSDGDTVWVRPVSGGRPLAVRLVGIDAPELCQAHGAEARQALDAQLRRRTVTVRVQGRDSYDRLLAQVQLQGQDVGGWLVASGHAWSSGWRSDPGPYAQQQSMARQARRGLWSAAALEPRRFRREHGPCERPGRAVTR